MGKILKGDLLISKAIHGHTTCMNSFFFSFNVQIKRHNASAFKLIFLLDPIEIRIKVYNYRKHE